MKPLLSIIFSLLMTLLAHGQTSQPSGKPTIFAEAALSSNHIIPAESVVLEVKITGAKPDYQPQIPQIENITTQYVSAKQQVINGGAASFIFSYYLTATKAGQYTIPSLAMSAQGKIIETAPIKLNVIDQSKLLKVSTGIENTDMFIMWITDQASVYPGQPVDLTLKIYTPQLLNVVNWGILDPVKENCLAWRFKSLPGFNNSVTINGEAHRIGLLTSVISGIAPGVATLKESKLPITIRQVVSETKYRRQVQDFTLDTVLPDFNLEITPFPSGAPDSFYGIVGNYEIRSHSEKPYLNANESTEVILQVGGIGNLESIKAPEKEDLHHSKFSWKTITTNKEARGKERRDKIGVVTFRQMLRPIVRDKDALTDPEIVIPSYSLTFFNPATKVYKTIRTEPIPVDITPSFEEPLTEAELTKEPEAEPIPEEMSEILGLIKSPNEKRVLLASSTRTIPLWSIIPAAACLLIVLIPLQRVLIKKFAKTPDQKEQRRDLAELSKQTTSASFYSHAGRYIARWIAAPNHDHEQIEQIIQTRDTLCFTSEKSNQEPIKEEHKKEIIELLKKLSMLIIGLCLLLPLDRLAAQTEQIKATTADDAYARGNYQQALDLYQANYPDAQSSIYGTPADIFYNMANCYQKLEQSGKAALLWRRALAVDPTHTQARTNLRFIEKENLAYTKRYQPWQNQLTRFHPSTFKFIYHFSFWVSLISLLSMIFLRSLPWLRNSLSLPVMIMMCSLFAGIAGYSAHYYYPDTDFHVDYTHQATVSDSSHLYQNAARSASDYHSITPASLLEVVSIRGTWANVKIIDNASRENTIEGWINKESIEPITHNNNDK